MEKHLLPLFAVLSGTTKPGTFAKGFRFVPSTSEENQAKGTLLVNLSLASTEKVDLDQLATQLINSLHERYYQNTQATIPAGLKEALAEVASKLKEILPSLGAHSLDIEITAAIVWGQFLYLGRLDKGEVYIARDNYFGPINFNKIASGRLQDGDWLFLANANFWQNLPQDELQTVIRDHSFDDALKKIDLVVGQKENISCVLANFKVEEDLEKDDTLTLVDPSQVLAKLPVNQTILQITSRVKAQVVQLGLRLWYGLRLIAKKSLALIKKRGKRDNLERVTGKAKKKWRLFIPLLIIVLTLGLMSNLYFKGRQDKKIEATQLLQEAISKKNEAINLQTLNSQKARELLSEAQTNLDQVKKINSKEKGLAELEKEISDLMSLFKREYRFAQLPVFYDLNPLQGNLQIASVAFGQESLVSLDTNSGSLLILNLKEKKGSVLVKDERLEGGTKLVVEGNTAFVSVGSKLIRFNISSQQFQTDLEVHTQIQDFSIYSGSVYVLTDNTLKRALLSGDSLTLTNYVASGSVDLTSGRGVSVDGFVWVSTSGSILKLSRGQREDFSLTGLDRGLKDPSGIYSNEAGNYLFLLDKENGRVVVFDKNGSYYAQYISPQIDEITSVIADESKNRLYLAGKEKIYLVEISKGQ